jgi:hypothetical protein
MNKFDKFLENFSSAMEKFYYIVSYPFIKVLNKLALFWLRDEVIERETYVEFLEDAMKVQRNSLNEYIVQNKNLSIRLEKFEKDGDSMTLHHKQWLEGEIARLTKTVRELYERNESLNSDSAKMLSAGNAVAELIPVNKPKKRLTKKDMQIKSVIDQWNESAKRWK